MQDEQSSGMCRTHIKYTQVNSIYEKEDEVMFPCLIYEYHLRHPGLPGPPYLKWNASQPWHFLPPSLLHLSPQDLSPSHM